MTHPKLDEIRKRLKAATPGPWKGDRFEIQKLDNSFTIATTTTREFFDSDFTKEQDEKNAVLIANTPTDLAFCLEYIGRLEAALIRCKKQRDLYASGVRSRTEHSLEEKAIQDILDGAKSP